MKLPRYSTADYQAKVTAAVCDGDLIGAFNAYREFRRVRGLHSATGAAPIDADTGLEERAVPLFSAWLDRAFDEAERSRRKG